MQTIDNQKLLLLIEDYWFFLSSSFGNGDGEPFFEVITAVEDLGKQEIQECPKFSKIILKRGSSQQ